MNGFPERLIAGRIAETVFEQMFRQGSLFDVYPLGYENTMPILKQFKDEIEHKPHKEAIERILHNFDDAPDFLLAMPDKSDLFSVEVKYMHELNEKRVRDDAEELYKKWDPVWLFVATKSAFYFSSCVDILYNIHHISPLSTSWISQPIQVDFIRYIKEFEK